MNAPHATASARPEQALAALGESCLRAMDPQFAAISRANDNSSNLSPAQLAEQIAIIAKSPSAHDAKLLRIQRLFDFSDAALVMAPPCLPERPHPLSVLTFPRKHWTGHGNSIVILACASSNGTILGRTCPKAVLI